MRKKSQQITNLNADKYYGHLIIQRDDKYIYELTTDIVIKTLSSNTFVHNPFQNFFI